MSKTKDFIDSIEIPNTAKVVKHVLKNFDDNIEKYSTEDLEKYILDLKPNSPKTIVTHCYVLNLYAKWLNEKGLADNTFLEAVKGIDKKAIWKKVKPICKKKFVGYEMYKQILHDIDVYEEFNSLYYRTLFQCIYEGVYNDDLSVLKNLRAKEVGENIVTLHEDNGHVYKLKISKELAQNMKELAETDIWERRNRFGICKVEMRGLYPDSVFKVEKRTTASDDALRFAYYSKLRKIEKDYLEHTLLPLQLYVSGIMYRIKTRLTKNGISVIEAFSDNNRNRKVYEIISSELIRCNYKTEVGNFREMVKGHVDIF
ncbi:MAG: hypothetical protein J6J15_05590 [Oscillospiraceae bacterium]|nr:hypothetical protein [Oscillospiraceae bacterium]